LLIVELWQLYLLIILPLFGASLLDVGPKVLDPAQVTL